MPVIRNALIEIEKFNNKQYDFVIMLQPTSPIRIEKQIYNITYKNKQYGHELKEWNVRKYID